MMSKFEGDGQKWMNLAKIKNYRLVLLVGVGFAIQEAITKVGAIDKIPLFFYPLTQTLKMIAHSRYLIPN